MKIKLNLSEVYFVKWIMKEFLEYEEQKMHTEDQRKEKMLLAQDILNKLNK
jgi:hypothetical protein